MALDARHRSSIYGKLVQLLGDDDTNALMSEFPSVEADELVTKDFLRAELAITRGDLRGEMADLRGEMTELRAEVAGLRGEFLSGIGGLRTDIERRLSQQLVRMYAALGLAVAVLGTLERI